MLNESSDGVSDRVPFCTTDFSQLGRKDVKIYTIGEAVVVLGSPDNVL